MKTVMCSCGKREKREDERMCDRCWDAECDRRDRYREAMNDWLDERKGHPRNNEEDP